MTIITIGSSDPNLDVFAVADVMETKGIVHIIVRRNFILFPILLSDSFALSSVFIVVSVLVLWNM